jgi:Uma2 family endonuclease
MASQAVSPLTVEAYLASPEDRSAEYVDGRLVERPMPGEIHSDIQWKLCFDFGDLARKTSRVIFGRPELHVRTAPGRVRIVDLAVYVDDKPNAQIPDNAPLIAIEILSPDDRLADVLDKLADYQAWGVRHIWLIQPSARRLLEYSDKALRETDTLEAPEIHAAITPERLFDAAQ